jgi:plasmid stabilization system protein ParE
MLGSNARRHCKPRNQVSISRRKTHPPVRTSTRRNNNRRVRPSLTTSSANLIKKLSLSRSDTSHTNRSCQNFIRAKNQNSKNEENEIRRSCGFSGFRLLAFFEQPATGTPPRYHRDATGPTRKDHTGRLQSKHQTTERRPASPSASRSLTKTIARTIASSARPKEIGKSSRQDSTGNYVIHAIKDNAALRRRHCPNCVLLPILRFCRYRTLSLAPEPKQLNSELAS